jgi:ribosomal protein L12E/L44/L45/RPP1/RPP2
MAEVIECLPSKWKALSSNSSTAKKLRGGEGERENQRERERKEEREGKEEEGGRN